MPPVPRGATTPVPPSSESRRCSTCSSFLQRVGVKALHTAAGNNEPAGYLIVETYHCPHCGKIEFFSAR
jgi:RNase P subunit RPR2